MRMNCRIWFLLVLGGLLSLAATAAPRPGQLKGSVSDALGRPIAGASVRLYDAQGRLAASARSRAGGKYQLRAPAGVYTLRIAARGFSPLRQVVRLTPGVAATRDASLALAPLRQQVVVAATGVPMPAAQSGQSVSLISRERIARLHGVTLARALAMAPGVQVLQTGATGGLTTVYLRGGDGRFAAVVLDGIPLQRFDFGSFDFSELLPGPAAELQVVRGPDSVLYGSGAVSGVIAVNTRNGRRRLAPELSGDAAWGSYATVSESDALAGAGRGFDYALDFAYLGAHNQIPNNHFRNANGLARLGWQAFSHTRLEFDLARVYDNSGLPNTILFYGIPDHAWQRQAGAYGGFSFDQQTTSHWHNQVQVSEAAANYFYEEPAPAGIPYNAGFGVNYIGLPVTIAGANGYRASGQAILTYGGVYPSGFGSDTLRRGVDTESYYTFSPVASLAAGYRYADERGLSSGEQLSRHEHGAFFEFKDGFWNRVFPSFGLAWDRNTPFGSAASPQASLAFYPRLGPVSGPINQTRFRANAGSAWEAPTLYDQASSLYQELLAAGDSAAIRQYGIQPVHPERSHDFDAGLDQYLFQQRLRISATFFDNRQYDLMEFVPANALPRLGVPANVAAQTFGADFNSLSESDKGLELSAAARLPFALVLRGAFTRLHARVLRSYSSDALAPSYNPAFANVPIGAFSPLAGARPFRRAPESGSLEIFYSHAAWMLDANGYFSSRRDDSTYLLDKDFGNSLLLPNHNLAPGFARINLAGGWNFSRRFSLHLGLNNLLNQHPQEVFGYPGLGRTIEAGIHFRWLPER